jgi:predicted enzyme related to lactoylglutathione lyase
MSDAGKPPPGSIIWTDLTVPDAEKVRDFYAGVVGWTSDPVSMGDYDDFNMKSAATGDLIAGVCHARGPNASLPAHWMMYVAVEDLDASTARCTELGGKVLVAPKGMGQHGRYCVIEDPAGAVMALFEPAG